MGYHKFFSTFLEIRKKKHRTYHMIFCSISEIIRRIIGVPYRVWKFEMVLGRQFSGQVGTLFRNQRFTKFYVSYDHDPRCIALIPEHVLNTYSEGEREKEGGREDERGSGETE